jgi:hypothetical protein
MPARVNFVPPREAIVDLRTGLMTRSWYLFFQSLYSSSLECQATIALAADYQGNISAGQLPQTIMATRKKAGSDVSAITSWSIVDVSGLSTGSTAITISTLGLVTIPAGLLMGASAQFTVRSIFEGSTLDQVVQITKTNGSSSTTGSGGGTANSTSTFTSITLNTFVAITAVIPVKTGTAGTVTFSAPLTTTVVNDYVEAFYDVACIWRIRPLAGAFSDVSVEVNSNPDARIFEQGAVTGHIVAKAGTVSCSPTQTGLTATTDYEAQLYARRTTTTPAKEVFFNGTASVAGS